MQGAADGWRRLGERAGVVCEELERASPVCQGWRRLKERASVVLDGVRSHHYARF